MAHARVGSFLGALVCSVAMGASAQAQNASTPSVSLNDAQVQMLMQQALGLQSCVKQADREGFARLNQEGLQAQKDIAALCKAGDREQAQYEAVRFAQHAKSSSTYQAMQRCASPLIMGMIDSMVMAAQQVDEKGNPSIHICDHIQGIVAQNY